VLQILERAAVPVHAVAGTSAGALAGALYCSGLTLDRLAAATAGLGWRQIARLAWSRRGLLTFDPLERWLAGHIGGVEFRDLPRPLAVVATDAATGAPVILREGAVAPAAVAACAVPGAVVPRLVAGRLLADGGASNNLPVRAARALGADYVIGVDLFQPGRWPLLGPLGGALWALENLVRRSGGGIDEADCLIVPDLAGQSYLRFGTRELMVARGAAAAEARLPEIRAALGLAAPA
jgi:NTE family protein